MKGEVTNYCKPIQTYIEENTKVTDLALDFSGNIILMVVLLFVLRVFLGKEARGEAGLGGSPTISKRSQNPEPRKYIPA